MIVLMTIDTKHGIPQTSQLTATMTVAVIAQQPFLLNPMTPSLIPASLRILDSLLVPIGRNLTILLPHRLPASSLFLGHHPADPIILLDLPLRIHLQAITWLLLIMLPPLHPFNLHNHRPLPRATLPQQLLQDETILTPDLTQIDELRQILHPDRPTNRYLALKTLEEPPGSHILPVLVNQFRIPPMSQLPPPIGLHLLRILSLNDRRIVTRSVVDIGMSVIRKGTLLNSIGIGTVKDTNLKPIGRRIRVSRARDIGNRPDSGARKGWSRILKVWFTQIMRPGFPFLEGKATSPPFGSLSLVTGDIAQKTER